MVVRFVDNYDDSYFWDYDITVAPNDDEHRVEMLRTIYKIADDGSNARMAEEDDENFYDASFCEYFEEECARRGIEVKEIYTDACIEVF